MKLMLMLAILGTGAADKTGCYQPKAQSGDWFLWDRDNEPNTQHLFSTGSRITVICGSLNYGESNKQSVCQLDGTWLPNPHDLCSKAPTTTIAYEALDYDGKAPSARRHSILRSSHSALPVPGRIGKMSEGCRLADLSLGSDEEVVHTVTGPIRASEGQRIPINDFVTIECRHAPARKSIAWCEVGGWERVQAHLSCPSQDEAGRGELMPSALSADRGCRLPLGIDDESLYYRIQVRPGGRLLFTCAGNQHRLIGVRVFYCKADGAWSSGGFFPRCRRTGPTCPAPESGRFENGISGMGGSQTSYTPGERVSFYCAAGYRRHGPPFLTCTSDGTWDTPRPLCVPGGQEREYKEVLGMIMVGALLVLLLLLLVLSLVHRRLIKSRIQASRRSILTQVDASRSRAEEVLAARRESDRLALLALADGAGLPTYADALSAPASPGPPSETTDTAEVESNSRRGSISTISGSLDTFRSFLRSRSLRRQETPAAGPMVPPAPSSPSIFPPPPPPYEPILPALQPADPAPPAPPVA